MFLWIFRTPSEELFVRFCMVVHFVIPKQCLITISPEEILDPNVLVWKFDFFIGEGSMDRVIVMFGVQFICVQQGQDDRGAGNTTNQ